MVDNTRIEIELLKKDVNIITSLCEKFDKTIDKMQEIATNLSRMISLQEQRLISQEETSKNIQDRLEVRRVEHNAEIKDLHSRITTVNRELTDKIEGIERSILEEIRLLSDEVKRNTNNKDEDSSIKNRLIKIENWQYMAVGAIMVITWILAKIDFGKLLKIVF